MKPFDPARTREVRRRARTGDADDSGVVLASPRRRAGAVGKDAPPQVDAAGTPGESVTQVEPASPRPSVAKGTRTPRPAKSQASQDAQSGAGKAPRARAASAVDPTSRVAGSRGPSTSLRRPMAPGSSGAPDKGDQPPAAPGRRGPRRTAGASGITAQAGPGLSRRSALGVAGEPRRSKADEAYLAIRNAIMDGTLAPGTALDKPAICRDLRLSRFPVTAAIARLAYERLVDVEPQRGSFVSRIAARDARELMLVRRGIEVELAGEAARHFDDDAVAALQRILRYQQAALAAEDFQDFHRLDHALHDQIIAGLVFNRAGEILESIRLRVERARRILLPVRGRMGRTFEEHTAIVTAIARHDPDAARAAMREHLHRVVDEFDVLSRERPDLFAP